MLRWKKLNADGMRCWSGKELERADLLFTSAAAAARESCCTAYATSLLNLAKVRMQRQHGDATVEEILSDVVSALGPLKAELDGPELALLSNAYVLRSHVYGISGKPVDALKSSELGLKTAENSKDKFSIARAATAHLGLFTKQFQQRQKLRPDDIDSLEAVADQTIKAVGEAFGPQHVNVIDLIVGFTATLLKERQYASAHKYVLKSLEVFAAFSLKRDDKFVTVLEQYCDVLQKLPKIESTRALLQSTTAMLNHAKAKLAAEATTSSDE